MGAGLDRTPRVAAVDHGARRVGVALSDGLGLTAGPVGTFSQDGAVDALRRLDAAHGLAVIVVGWPLDEDGSEGAAADRVRPYVNRLRRAFPGARVVTSDERLSSREAQERLYEAGAWRRVRRDKGLVDAAAACVILEDWLRETRDAERGTREDASGARGETGL